MDILEIAKILILLVIVIGCVSVVLTTGLMSCVENDNYTKGICKIIFLVLLCCAALVFYVWLTKQIDYLV